MKLKQVEDRKMFDHFSKLFHWSALPHGHMKRTVPKPSEICWKTTNDRECRRVKELRWYFHEEQGNEYHPQVFELSEVLIWHKITS